MGNNNNEVQYEWVCRVCGWSVVDIEPPEICPQCGAPKQFFEPMTPDGEDASGA